MLYMDYLYKVFLIFYLYITVRKKEKKKWIMNSSQFMVAKRRHKALLREKTQCESQSRPLDPLIITELSNLENQFPELASAPSKALTSSSPPLPTTTTTTVPNQHTTAIPPVEETAKEPQYQQQTPSSTPQPTQKVSTGGLGLQIVMFFFYLVQLDSVISREGLIKVCLVGLLNAVLHCFGPYAKLGCFVTPDFLAGLVFLQTAYPALFLRRASSTYGMAFNLVKDFIRCVVVSFVAYGMTDAVLSLCL